LHRFCGRKCIAEVVLGDGLLSAQEWQLWEGADARFWDGGPGTFDPNVWSGRALQEGFAELSVSGLASMYPASDWSCRAPGHHGYQRACDLITGQASSGHLGHQCSHAPGRPILHLVLILSQTSAGSVLATSLCSPHRHLVGPFLDTFDNGEHRVMLIPVG
jgi:hypothetical protein